MTYRVVHNPRDSTWKGFTGICYHGLRINFKNNADVVPSVSRSS